MKYLEQASSAHEAEIPGTFKTIATFYLHAFGGAYKCKLYSKKHGLPLIQVRVSIPRFRWNVLLNDTLK